MMPYTAQQMVPSLIFNIGAICLPVLMIALVRSDSGRIKPSKSKFLESAPYNKLVEKFEDE
jgi:hypothetical protein